jgi:hypothetical protein
MKRFIVPVFVFLLGLTDPAISTPCIDYSSHLHSISTTPLSASPTGFSLQGDLALVAAGMGYGTTNGSLHILDVSSPADPTVVTTFTTPGSCAGVALSDGYAYVADGHPGLQIVDVGRPDVPTFVTGLNFPNYVWSVRATDTQVFVLGQWGEVPIVQITDPTNPELQGSIPTSLRAEDLVVVGTKVYLTDGLGLRIAEISNPWNPQIVGTLPLSYPIAVAVHGDLAYVSKLGTWDLGFLFVVDVSDPTNPVLLSEIAVESMITQLQIDGNRLYGSSEGIEVFDISVPIDPIHLGRMHTLQSPRGFGIRDDVFLAPVNVGPGIQSVDVSNPTAPEPLGSLALPIFSMAALVRGDLAYIGNDLGLGNGYGNLFVIDVSDPSSPSQIGALATWTVLGIGAMSGNYLALGCGDSGVRIVDVSNPAAPTIVGARNTPGQASRIAVSGSHAFIADAWAGLQIMTVANPANPQIVGTYATSGSAVDVAVEGSRAYVVDRLGASEGLIILDVTAPSNPLLLDNLSFPVDDVGAVAVSGNLAYVSGTGTIFAVDVTNPTNAQVIGSLMVPGGSPASDLELRDGTLYAAHWENLFVIDVTDPTNPGFRGQAATSQGRCVSVGDDLVLLAGTEGIVGYPLQCGAASVGVPTLAGSEPLRVHAAPNPFRAGTKVSFSLANEGDARLTIHDVAGRLVRELTNGPRPAGAQSFDWDGRDTRGAPVSAGVYLVRLQGDATQTSERIVRLK